MTGDWTLRDEDITTGAPRRQTCQVCGLTYARVRFATVEPDGCPMCRLTQDVRERNEQQQQIAAAEARA